MGNICINLSRSIACLEALVFKVCTWCQRTYDLVMLLFHRSEEKHDVKHQDLLVVDPSTSKRGFQILQPSDVGSSPKLQHVLKWVLRASTCHRLMQKLLSVEPFSKIVSLLGYDREFAQVL